MARLKHRVPVWLLAKHWWCHRGAHIVLILLVVAAFPLYGIYSAWSTAVGRHAGERQIEDLELPAQALWTMPAWLATAGDWDMERVLASPDLDLNLADYTGAIRVPAVSSIGIVDAWGLDPGWTGRHYVNIVADGTEPGPGEALVERSLAGSAGVDRGQTLTLIHLHPFTRSKTEMDVTVTGWFEAESPLVAGVIVNRGELEHLTGYSVTNAALLEATMRPPRFVGGARPIIERQPQFLVEHIEEVKPFGPARMPAVSVPGDGGGSPASTYLPFATTVGDTMFWEPRLPSRALGSLYTLVESMTGLVALAFFLGGLGVTIAILVVVLDQERDLGIYKALGFTPEEMFRVYSTHMAFNIAVGTALGAPALRYLMPVASSILGLELTLQPTALLVWALASAALVLWAGRVVAVLFSGPSVVSLLKEETGFDWWSLVRIAI